MSEHICAKCGRDEEWGGCCLGSEVAVTSGDIERVAAYVGSYDFYERKGIAEHLRARYSNPDYVPDGDHHWVRIVFDREGKRPVLRHHPDGYCIFLENGKGCRLPMDVRPLYCRIYPFDFNAEGITGLVKNGCPAHLLPEGRTLLDALEMDEATGESWRNQMYREFEEDYRKREM
jgi:Fe-S-cluster containining protein